MNPNYNNQIPGSELIKQFFTRTSMLTITIASAMLSALIIFQTVIYTFSGDKISMCFWLYNLFGIYFIFHFLPFNISESKGW